MNRMIALSAYRRAIANNGSHLHGGASSNVVLSSLSSTSSSSSSLYRPRRQYKSTAAASICDDTENDEIETPSQDSNANGKFSIKGSFREGRASYLDTSATTPMDPRVLDKMMPYMVRVCVYTRATSFFEYGFCFAHIHIIVIITFILFSSSSSSFIRIIYVAIINFYFIPLNNKRLDLMAIHILGHTPTVGSRRLSLRLHVHRLHL